jgi:hypothetical protein
MSKLRTRLQVAAGLLCPWWVIIRQKRIIDQQRELLAAAGDGANVNSIKLGRLALAVIDHIGKRASSGEQLTIAPDWGYGTATLITGDGSHTHVGGDTGESTHENLAMLILGLYDQLVGGQGLSWVHPRDREVQP